MLRKFTQVDVFTAAPLRGNPLAVVHDAAGLSDTQMAEFARWTNLSETTFLLPPTDANADYRLRIFTPGGELPFAGHPTLGTCHAWLAAGGTPRRAGEVVQQCGVGLVRIRRDGGMSAPKGAPRPAPQEGAPDLGRPGVGRLAFAAPPTTVEPVEPALLDRVLTALGLDAGKLRDAAFLTNGPRQMALLLDSAASVLALEPDHAGLKKLAKVGVFGPHPEGSGCDYEARFFAAAIGVDEDPVTGSLNANLAQWLTADGRARSRYVVAQGTRLGRAGRVHVQRDADGTVWIGGDSVTLIEGQMCL